MRRITEETGLRWSDDAPFAPGTSLGAALLEPTRIYVAPVLDTIRTTRAVKAVAHITGGGLLENIPRVVPAGLTAKIDLGSVPIPEVFRWLAQKGPVAEAEMIRTFNCGIGLVMAVESAVAGKARSVLEKHGEKVVELGSLVPRTSAPVIFKNRLDLGG